MTFKPTLTFPLFLIGSIAAQAPSFTTFGNPCIALPPPLTALNLPRVGQVFQLQVLSSGSNSVGYEGGVASALVSGFSRTSFAGAPLPWTPAFVQSLGAGSCGDLSVSAEFMLPLPFMIPRTTMTLGFPIPTVPALVGTSVFFQAIDYAMNRRGQLAIYMGTAGEARIGL